MKFSALGENS